MNARSVLLSLLLACGGQRAVDPNAPTTASDPAMPEARDSTPEPLDHWTTLGERVLAEDGKHDSIRASADEGRFSSVRFVIKFGKLEITNVTITFDDGSKATIPKRLPFGNGTLSRAIDLPGDRKVIRQIDFDYVGVRAGRSTHLEIWAQ